ncbi:MAG: SpoIIE family protein phosphatase [Anaerolineales bacterium]|nr:SpoIIE family protein phosphatase [Anaerolineales bacterium]
MEFFERLLNRFKTSSARVEIAPSDMDELRIKVPAGSERKILVGTAQSTGLERSHNEDALLIMQGNSAGEEMLPEFGLFIVADGMGGHRAGEIASAISVRQVAHRITQDTILNLFDGGNNADIPPLQEMLREALEDANTAVVERVPGGGTTLTAALLLGQQVTIGHVGDSRAYMISNDGIKALTRDHSLVERLKELGQLSEAEAATHPQRNVLYRAVGQGANLEVDVLSHPIPADGYLLVCSDGLWGVVPEEKIENIVLNNNDPQEACEKLVQAANAAGGPDNITAILVHFPKV